MNDHVSTSRSATKFTEDHTTITSVNNILTSDGLLTSKYIHTLTSPPHKQIYPAQQCRETFVYGSASLGMSTATSDADMAMGYTMSLPNM